MAHGIVAAIFKAAARDRKVASSPCEGVKLPKVEPRQIVPLSTEAVLALAAAVPPGYEALVLLAAGTGCDKRRRSGSPSIVRTSCGGA